MWCGQHGLVSRVGESSVASHAYPWTRTLQPVR
jgi:hypothetical protein